MYIIVFVLCIFAISTLVDTASQKYFDGDKWISNAITFIIVGIGFLIISLFVDIPVVALRPGLQLSLEDNNVGVLGSVFLIIIGCLILSMRRK